MQFFSCIFLVQFECYLVLFKPQMSQIHCIHLQYKYMDLNFQRFDKVITQLKARDLLEVTTLTQEHPNHYYYIQKSKSLIKNEIYGKGPAKDMQKYMEIEALFPADERFNKLTFQTFLQNGDKFPNLYNLVNLVNGQKVEIVHKEGEILIVYFWTRITESSSYQLKIDLQTIYSLAPLRPKINVLFVNIGNDVDSFKNFSKTQGNKQVKCIMLGQNIQDQTIKRYFNIPKYDHLAIFINKRGFVQYVRDQFYETKTYFQEMAKRLTDDNPQKIPLPNKCDHSQTQNCQQIKQESFFRIQNNLQNAKKKYPFNRDKCLLVQNVKKSWANGKQKMCYGKLRGSYTPHLIEQTQVFPQILQMIQEGVSEQDLCFNFWRSHDENKFQQNFKKLSIIAEKCGFSKIQCLNILKINLLQKYPTSKKPDNSMYFRFNPLCREKQITIQMLVMFKSQVENFLKTIQGDVSYNLMKEFASQSLQKSYIGNTFINFGNLKNPISKQATTLNILEGRQEIIWYYPKSNQILGYVTVLTNLAKYLGNDTHINVITVYSKQKQIKKIQDLYGNLVTFYQIDQQFPDLSISTDQKSDKLWITNKNRIVVWESKFDKQQTIKILNYSFQQSQQMPKQRFLINEQYEMHTEGINKENQIIVQIRALSKLIESLDYSPVLQLTCVHWFQTKQCLKPQVRVKIRRSEYKSFRKIIHILKKKNMDIHIQFIQIYDIPSGHSCDECSHSLKLPYYYFYFSSTFRCLFCTSQVQSDFGTPLQKYAVKENGILIFKENTSVDRKRLGSNIKPGKDQKAKAPQFNCSGCGINSFEQCRYTCLGCCREPNLEGEFVDFCHKCACQLTFGENDKNDKKNILEKTQSDGHRADHPLLKINFQNGYWYY